MIAVELFRKVLVHSEQNGTIYELKQDPLFKIFVVCFFIANKYMDDINFITLSDAAYLCYSSENTVKLLEIALLDEILDWNLLDLKEKNSKGEYVFLKWDYNFIRKSFLLLVSGC